MKGLSVKHMEEGEKKLVGRMRVLALLVRVNAVGRDRAMRASELRRHGGIDPDDKGGTANFNDLLRSLQYEALAIPLARATKAGQWWYATERGVKKLEEQGECSRE